MNKKTIIAIAAIAVLLLGAVLTWHFTGHAGLDHGDHASHHGHDDHGGTAQNLELDDGEKWATDTHLRSGMSTIHERVKPAYAAYQKGDFSAEQSKEIAELIRTEVDTLIEKCNLEPKADAMLHIVIGDMMSAASAMESDPQSEEGMPKLVAALQAYSRHFDHPGF